ncbi:DNA polymerase II [Candidatus Micrarchaeota archaeon CG08_land_8_20_14_0_20_59_11]|nr:MAG: DNA polymerase II [Candidatus Micrarchaeota archaeon CG08_land_8_20_14_0_20_59_11]
MLVEPAALELLASLADGDALLDAAIKAAASKNAFLVTHAAVDQLLSAKASEKKTVQIVVEHASFRAPAAEMNPDIKLDVNRDITDKSRCTGTIENFRDYFRDRFARYKRLFHELPSQIPLQPIARVRTATDPHLRVIGMVANIRGTRKADLLIEIDDEEDTLPCFVGARDKALFDKAKEVLLDEVVCFEGRMYNSLFIVKDVQWPGIPFRQKRVADTDACVALLSDLHVGSKFFMQENFERFIRFLNGDTDDKKTAENIKYVVIAGDVVDGIGVYPSQEKQLVTKDIYEQYKLFGELAKKIPDYIEVVISPGNHDAVRTAEPQPRLPAEFTQDLEDYPNMHFVGNPAWIEIHGVKFLIYHGTSLDTLIPALPSLGAGYEFPEKVGIEMLKHRHLAPIYGEKPLVPEKRDYMIIEEAPDVFHFGHVHKNGYADYRGTSVINSGTWQSRTDYQIRLGHHPSPCLLPVYSLRSGTTKILNFS